MKVIVAGGYRTGTTHAYMIVRAVLEARGIEHLRAGVSAPTAAAFLALPDWAVLKTHDVITAPAVGCRVVLCSRNPYDSVASRCRIGGSLDVALEELAAAAAVLEHYRALPETREIAYESYYDRPADKVRAIASHVLGEPLDERAIAAIAAATSVEAVKPMADALEEADPETELRPGHVGPALGRPNSYLIDDITRRRIDAALKESVACSRRT